MRRARAPGQLLAEVALVVLLLAALALSWPARVPFGRASESGPIIPLARASLQSSSDGPAVDDLAPRRGAAPQVLTATIRPSARPVQLLISSVNLHPLVESVGVDRSGAMDVPRNYFDVGWYNLGPIPGDPGDAVIDGHAGYPDQPLVFAKLAKLQFGDRIVVVLADGTERTFKVASVKTWPARSHPTGLFEPDGPARLTLVTCTGQYDDKKYSYADRLVVEATYTGQL